MPDPSPNPRVVVQFDHDAATTAGVIECEPLLRRRFDGLLDLLGSIEEIRRLLADAQDRPSDCD